jgi:hypothetical protein
LAAGGKSIQQQMIDQDVGRIAIAKRLDHVDGIQAARATLPFCMFDKTNCEQGLECLRNYHYEWDEELKKFSEVPRHDWSSHGASAFRTLSLSWKRPSLKGERPLIIESTQYKQSLPNTFGEMKNRHLNKMKQLRESRI